MFLPSDTAVVHLCNALFALSGWRGVLEGRGLADPQEFIEMMEFQGMVPQMEADFYSWQNLKGKLDYARQCDSEQLRLLMGDLLRRRDEYAGGAKDSTAFRDALAQLEVDLGRTGYTFDGFEMVLSKPLPSIAQLSDQALEAALGSRVTFPLLEKVRDHLEHARQRLSEGNYPDCLTNLRHSLKYTLEGIARLVSERKGETLPSVEEHQVREYLKKVGVFSKEECRGFSGIYGLLSAGAHGAGDRQLALLGYAACVMTCHYALGKLD